MEQSLIEIENGLCAYVERTLGVRLRLEAFIRRLPLWLEGRFSFRLTRLCGHELLLCFVREGFEESPGGLDAAAQALRESIGAVPVFVIPGLSSWDRERLIRRRVAFIVSGTHLYLPELLVELREVFHPVAAVQDKLPWLAQVILITHLIKESLEGETVRGLSRRLGYPASTLSRAMQAFEVCGFSDRSRGRTRPLSFVAGAADLWKMARPRLRSPVICRYSYRGSAAFETWPVSGEEALNALTDVSGREERCRAVSAAVLREERAAHAMDFRDEPVDEGMLVLESWAYDPRPLACRGIVDPCSLALAYADEADERVQKGLEQAVVGSLRQ